MTTGTKLNDGSFHKLTVTLSNSKAEVKVESSSCAGGICKVTAVVQASSSSSFQGKPFLGGLENVTPLIRSQIAGDGNFVGCIEVSMQCIVFR